MVPLPGRSRLTVPTCSSRDERSRRQSDRRRDRVCRGRAQAAGVDVDDRDSVERHADDVLAAIGRVGISFNAVGMDAVQDSALLET